MKVSEKMKKGFTLIELLGVIIIIAVIATVAVVSIDKSIQKGKKTACLAEEKSIIEAAETWQTDNPIITANNIYILTMLTNSGYLEKDLKNPMTGKAYKVGTHVKITPAEGETGKYSYDYKLVYGTGDKACDGTDGENSEEIITVDIPTAEYCKPSLIYTGSSQTLVKAAGEGYTWSLGTKRTNAGSQNISASLKNGFVWLDESTDVKTINCSIAKATPTITLSASSGIIEKVKTKTFNATVKSGASNAKVSGTLNVVSANTAKATVSPTNTTITNADNSTGVSKTETVKGVAVGDNAITVKFTPTDTTNYNNAANKTYTAKVRNFVPVPTAANYCNSLKYTGASQTLVKAAGTGFTWTAGTTRTTAGSQNVTATLSSGYAWSDGSTGTKTISCSIAKATPVITLSATSGAIIPGKTKTFTATVKSGASNASVSGNLNVVSGDTSKATVTPTGNVAITNANNSTGISKTETVKGVASGTSTITVKFTPSDTTNYGNAANKTYSATILKLATIPTAANYCNSLKYTGSSQTLVKAAGTGFTWTAGTTRTTAGSQNVTATPSSGYAWSDGSTGTKTISCSIGKATPTITLSATSGTVETNKNKTFKATVKSGASSGSVSGTLNVTSSNTAKLTVSPNGNKTITGANNSSGSANTITMTGKAMGSATVTVKFTPTDTTNYNNAANKTYTATIKFTGTIYRVSEIWWKENETNISSYATPRDYSTSVPSGKVIYLKHGVTNNIVTSTSVCFIYNNTTKCMQSYPTSDSIHATNVNIIKAYQSYYRLATINGSPGSPNSCGTNGSRCYRCRGGSLGFMQACSRGGAYDVATIDVDRWENGPRCLASHNSKNSCFDMQ